MKLTYPLLVSPIEFSEQNINVLVIENAVELRNAVFMLKRQLEGYAGDFVLSEGHEPIDFAKYVSLVTDPFSIELSSKKIDTKLNQEAHRIAADFGEDIHKILDQINNLALRISTFMDFETTFTEIESVESLIKLLEIGIDETEMSLPEKLIEHMKIQRVFFGKKLFVFYNIKACLMEEEIRLFYKSAAYERFNVLLIEDTQRRSLAEEKTVIIDNDLCVF